MTYIISAANLHAFNYGLKGDTDRSHFKRVAGAVVIPEFSPKSNMKVQINENDAAPDENGMLVSCSIMLLWY